MNEIAKFFEANTGNLIHKWSHYFDIYEKHFQRFRGKEMVLLEFGISHGGSIDLWKKYFGEQAKIIAVDVIPECKKFEDGQVQVFIGDQADRNFLRHLRDAIPKIDILIDDGGHTMTQQIATFEELYGHVNENGVYLCEDLHTSYWPEYGGGYMRDGTFVEYSKNFIDYLNSWHFDIGDTKGDFIKSHAKSLTYYDSILVIEKGTVSKPQRKKIGHIMIDCSNSPIETNQENNAETHKYARKSGNETAIKRRDYNHLWAIIDGKTKELRSKEAYIAGKDEYIVGLETANNNLKDAFEVKSTECSIKDDYIAGLEESQKLLKAINEDTLEQLAAIKKRFCWKVTDTLKRILRK